MCVFLWRPVNNFCCHSSDSMHLLVCLSLRQGLSLAWGLLSRLSRSVSPRDLHVSSSTRILNIHKWVRLGGGAVLGLKCGSSCFQGKQFTDYTIFYPPWPTPPPYLMRKSVMENWFTHDLLIAVLWKSDPKTLSVCTGLASETLAASLYSAADTSGTPQHYA